VPRYFQFDVPPDIVTTGAVQTVSFYVTGVSNYFVGAQSNVTIVLSEHLPLPDLSHYDYISSLPDTNDTIIMLVTNSTPFPIQTNRWYVGIFNQADTDVPLSVESCVSSDYPLIVPLTNSVAFVSGLTNGFFAPPGPPRQFFFEFQVTNEVEAILFEMYNLSGDLDLVVQRDLPPTMAPYYAGSFQSPNLSLLHSVFAGTNWEQIVLRVTPEVPSLIGNWYIGLYNNETRNVSYSLRAATSSNGLLLSVQEPPPPTISFLSDNRLLLSWYSVKGEYYQVQSSPSGGNLNWQPVPGGLVRATTPETTIVLPAVGGTLVAYRIVHLSSRSLPFAALQIELWTGNQVRLSWSAALPYAILQYADRPSGPWFDANLPASLVGTQYVVFDTIQPIPRFYRLIQ
jgi:hypothetical protein